MTRERVSPPEAGEVAWFSPVSARVLPYIIAGDVEHHVGIVRERCGLTIPPVAAPRQSS